jgi:hypothetical protein
LEENTMTDLERHASTLIERAETASHAERIRLQPQIDRVITTLTMQGHTVPLRLRTINNTLKDEALDDMFDNMPV